MRTDSLRVALIGALVLSAQCVFTQWTAAPHPLLSAPTTGVTIGTLGAGPAALNVFGDQMLPTTAELIRTRAANTANGYWRMFRGTTELGRFYQTNPFNAFRVQAVQPNGAQPGILYLENAETDGIMLRANGAQANVNGYPLRLDGFGSVGIKNGGMIGMPSRSRWHLVDVDGVSVVEPWRPYYRNGVLFSGNNDMAYIGHRYLDAGNGTTPWNYTLDRSDLLISAGENDMTDVNRQRIRFTYTTTPAAAGSTVGADSYNGLEFMQLWPESNTEGYLGVGDFTAASATPTERVDLLTKTIRFRDFMDATLYRNDNYDRVLVANPADGRVYWRPASSISSCDWLVTPPAQKRLLAAWATPSGASCPEEDWRVGIGTLANIQSKLRVYGRTSVGAHSGAIQADFQASGEGVGGSGVSASVTHETAGTPVSGDAIGVLSNVTDAGYRGSAVQGEITVAGSGAETMYGLNGRLTLNSGSNTSVAAYGTASNVITEQSSAANKVFGMYTTVTGPGSMNSVSGVSSLVNLSGGTTGSSYGADATSQWGASTSLTNSTGMLAKSTNLTSTMVQKSIGADVSASGGSVQTLGVQASGYGEEVEGVPTVETKGVKSTALGPVLLATGVYGKGANYGFAFHRRVGVHGATFVSNSDLVSEHISILGEGAGNGAQQWAGLFESQVQIQGNLFNGTTLIFSDASLKTDVQEVGELTSGLMSLLPRRYQYTDEAKARLNLPDGEQFGFVAQELEEQYPHLVMSTIAMARRDSVGNVTAPAMEIKAVNYVGLVPLLVSGHQQQENRLAAVEGQLAQVLEQLAACCADSDGTRALAGGTVANAALENDLRIVPNPVADRTELRYTVANEGRVRLEITDASSRIVLTREEGQRSAGSFMYEWDTTLLAPGTYICTLYINDEFLVKKSVKLGTR